MRAVRVCIGVNIGVSSFFAERVAVFAQEGKSVAVLPAIPRLTMRRYPRQLS
jgi:hypothetical protein